MLYSHNLEVAERCGPARHRPRPAAAFIDAATRLDAGTMFLITGTADTAAVHLYE